MLYVCSLQNDTLYIIITMYLWAAPESRCKGTYIYNESVQHYVILESIAVDK